MKKTIILAIIGAIALAWASFALSKENPQIMPEISVQELSVKEMSSLTAMMFGQDPKLLNKIMWCESHGQVSDHDGGRGLNVTGIHDQTFDLWLPQYEKDIGESLDKTKTWDQLKMMAWAFSKGEDYRDDWTTYVAYMSPDHTYSFYSTLLKAHFTVVCK
jgi:hypothetical protein